MAPISRQASRFLFFSAVVAIAVFFIGQSAIKKVPGAQADTSDTEVRVMMVCGDGFWDNGSETCDPGNVFLGLGPDTGTTTCQDFIDPYSGTFFASGTLGCLADCSDFVTSTCYTCGNNVMQYPGEECDGSDFGASSTCISYGYTGGSLHCTPDCRLDLADCVVVGTHPPTPGETPTTGGGGGGNRGNPFGYFPGQKTEPDKTIVIVKGKSYPNSDVRVLIDGKVVGIVKADSKADFRFETDNVMAGITTFGFWTEDERGLKSTLLTLTFRIASKSITNISNVYLSPTIDVDKKKVNRGENIKIFGKSSPEVALMVHVNSAVEKISSTTSNPAGDWILNYNTKDLEEDFHTARALIRLTSVEGVIESNFSRTVSFYVGEGLPKEGECGIADLNCDGSVNLVDFSILLYHWGTANKPADINADGKVGLTDFSIMMYYWTG